MVDLYNFVAHQLSLGPSMSGKLPRQSVDVAPDDAFVRARLKAGRGLRTHT